MLSGAIAVGTQLTEPRSAIRLSNGWQIDFLQPGLQVNATVYNNRALPADTTIKIVYRDSNNNITGSGMLGLPGRTGSASIEQMMESKKASRDQCRMDTIYKVMGQMKQGDESGIEYQVDEIAGAKHGFLPDSGIISRNPLVFADAASAKRYFLLRSYDYRNKITASPRFNGTLRIEPADRWERMGFAFHDLVKFGCISLLFLFLSRLFRNFSKQHFFTLANIRLLRNTSLLMLAISLVSILLYFFLLRDMHPVTLEIDQNAEILSMLSYNLALDINWMLITVGVSMLVLAWIFRNGLEMKEKEIYTF
jgi:hypothetical protein